VLKKQILLISIIYSITLVSLSLINIGNPPDYVPSFSDKIFHFLAYCLLTVLWFFTFIYRFKKNKISAYFLAAIFSITLGIIIEVLQGGTTEYRSGDLNDVFANVLGVAFAESMLILKNKLGVKKE
jgi:VanZ family protein